MNFDPSIRSALFTSVGTLASVWIFAALGLLSLLGARRILRGPSGRKVSGTIAGALLSFVCVVSWLVVVAWLFNRHV